MTYKFLVFSFLVFLLIQTLPSTETAVTTVKPGELENDTTTSNTTIEAGAGEDFKDYLNMKSFDARKKWPKCAEVINQVSDQGKCSSGWAIQAAAVTSDRICIETNGTQHVHISPEDIMTCCKDCLKNNTEICGGGLADKAFSHLLRVGSVTEGCKPYSQSLYNHRKKIPCVLKCTNTSYWNTYTNDKYRIEYLYRVPSIKKPRKIQEDIVKNGPVVAFMKVYPDLKEHSKGVYENIWGSYLYAHHVKIIGWGVDDDNNKYWLCVNSWGKKWGSMNGFFKIFRGENTCKIESNVHAAKYMSPFVEHRRELYINNGRSLLVCVYLPFILFFTITY